MKQYSQKKKTRHIFKAESFCLSFFWKGRPRNISLSPMKKTFIHIYIHRKPYSKSIINFEGLHKRPHVEINACVKNSHGSQQVELKSNSLCGLTKFVDHSFSFSFQKLLQRTLQESDILR